MNQKFFLFIATGAGCGYFPKAPGTAGSVAGILLYFLLIGLPPALYLAFTLLLALVGVHAARIAESHFNKKDPKEVVIDEIAGMLLSLFLVPPEPLPLLAGFLLFRLLDIAKPGLRRLEKMEGGWGIMLDDVAAGIMANGMLHGTMAILNL